MALVVQVEPERLPALHAGETIQVKIGFKGSVKALRVHLVLTGAKGTQGEKVLDLETGITSLEQTLVVPIVVTGMEIPVVYVSSPDGQFNSFVIVGEEPLTDIDLKFTPPQPRDEPTEEFFMSEPERTNTQPKERTGLMLIVGAVAALLVIAGVFAWRQSRNDSPPPTVPPIDEAEKSRDDGTPAEEPEAVTAAEKTTKEPATADPTNCTFLNGGRPRVGEKYILQCAEGQFTATGIYTVDHFVWSDFEEHPTPK